MANWDESNQASCGGKKSWLTWKQAQTFNNGAKKGRSGHKGKRIEHLEPYRCLNCGLWHLGHPSRKHRERGLKGKRLSHSRDDEIE